MKCYCVQHLICSLFERKKKGFCQAELIHMPKGLVLFRNFLSCFISIKHRVGLQQKNKSPPNLGPMHSHTLAKLEYDVWCGHLRLILAHSKPLLWANIVSLDSSSTNYSWTSCLQISLSPLFHDTSVQWLQSMVVIIPSMECAVYW